MFTGIIEETGIVSFAGKGKLCVNAGFQDLKKGESICVNGACLTATEILTGGFTADISPVTREKTNLAQLKRGDKVNLERSLKAGERLGGHMVTGHIDGKGTIKKIKKQGNSILMDISCPQDMFNLIANRGSIALDGVSLTVADVVPARVFSVSIIPHTASHTTLGIKKHGDTVNIELDILARYAQKSERKGGGGITMELLKEKGFL